MTKMKVPFMNLARQNQALKSQYLQAFERVVDSGGFILGAEVKKFEQEFAGYQGTRYCLGTSSGTTALHLALAACGIGPGDEVITVTNTFIATVEAIVHSGARPVLVDMDPDTYLLDPGRLEAAVTSRTRAIIPVHLYGAPAPMDEILKVTDRNGLAVIEDAAQAHGTEYKGRRVGGFGRAAAFSFYPGKNLGALGDAGAVTTNDTGLYEKMLLLRDHGSAKKYYHDYVGFNYRMDALKGALLSIKLGCLDRWNDIRRDRAALYRRRLAGAGLMLPVEPAGARHVYHLFVVQVPERERLIGLLSERGVATGIHYPIPVHRQKAFEYLGYGPGSFPAAEQAAPRILSLPLCADITEEEVEYVCESLKECLEKVG